MSRLRTSPDPPLWPGLVTFRRRLAVGIARPWNARHEDASLRVRRGDSGFIRLCAAALEALGAPAVYSPPLPPDQLPRWQRAGFETALRLALLRLDLPADLPESPQEATVTASIDLDALVAIDEAAFGDFWAFDHAGITESIGATKRAFILVVGDPPAGYAIVGFTRPVSYLQRIAVEPSHQGRGMGTDLVAAAAREAHRRGCRSLFLNAETSNDGALRLYDRLGFQRLTDGLHLMRR